MEEDDDKRMSCECGSRSESQGWLAVMEGRNRPAGAGPVLFLDRRASTLAQPRSWSEAVRGGTSTLWEWPGGTWTCWPTHSC